MNNEMKVIKFEHLISNINESLQRDTTPGTVSYLLTNRFIKRESKKIRKILTLIYDYDKLNRFGKIILNRAEVEASYHILGTDSDIWEDTYSTASFKDNRMKVEAAKQFFAWFKESNSQEVGYQLLFWALLVLTVDKTDADEKLSLICDFARILNVTDDEMEDIVNVIKVVYQEVDTELTFKSENIPEIFHRTIGIYDN